MPAHLMDRTPPTVRTAPEPFRVSRQFWFIAKNVIGWLLMLVSPVIGIALPGPGGVPLFLLGFALATIPGKRRMTSHAMRGRPVRVNQRLFVGIVSAMGTAACAAIVWSFERRFDRVVDRLNLTGDARGRVVALVVGLCVLAIVVSYVAAKLGTLGMNLLFRALPRARRLIRPYLKRYGVALLPPRRKSLAFDGSPANENEILEFGPDSRRRARSAGAWLVQWGRRALVLGIVFYLFFRILRPVVLRWPQTVERLGRIQAHELAGSVLMFALFLAVVRARSWWAILAGFGFRVPRTAALRVWITSEMARYLPGAIWQVVSRVRQVKAYGVRGSVCSTSQVLELAIFLLANVCLAVACLLFLGFKTFDGPARQWLLVAMFLVPLLSLILHPRVFYGIADRILARLGKPPIASRLPIRSLLRIFAGVSVGLLWQSLALWLLLHVPLGIGIRDWWILAGAYSLAWTAGFIAGVWAPAGIGVREAVLIAALSVALPAAVRERMGDAATLQALSVVTRLWTIAAEVLVAAVAYPLDWRGVGRNPVARVTVADREAERATPIGD